MSIWGIHPVLNDNATILIMALLSSFCLVALWSTVTRTSPEDFLPLLGRKAKRIYLETRFVEGGANATRSSRESGETAYLTVLSLRGARMFVSRSLEKGSILKIDLQSLPGYGGPAGTIDAVVTRSTAVNSVQNLYEVRVRFTNVERSLRAPLRGFVGQLAN